MTFLLDLGAGLIENRGHWGHLVMGFLNAILKLLAGGIALAAALAVLILLFELPPLLFRLILGPMHPELAQVYTMIEIGLILAILIFGLPKGYHWFNKRWDRWAGK